jgi:hypothetical protein
MVRGVPPAPAPSAAAPAPAGRHVLSSVLLQRLTLWLAVFSSCVAFIEPSPFEVMFALLAVVFLVTRLSLPAALIPLLLTLGLYNLGGLIALVPFTHIPRSVMFIAISIYLAIACVIFAAIFAEDTRARLIVMERAWIAGGAIAAFAGVVGYFNIGGLGAIFTFNERASGTFKDPNVLGTYLTFPFVALVLGVALGDRPLSPFRLAALGLVTLGILLSFSRGAWGIAVGASGLAVLLAFLTSTSTVERARIIGMSMVGLALIVGLLTVALSFEEVRSLFEMRASLSQSYDVQSGGRFDNQIKSLPMLLERPNGFGPLRFSSIFPEDPHNVYINGFASYGWLGGFAYLAFSVLTVIVGVRCVATPSPFRREAIAVFATLAMLMLQGFTIDTDHWRHFYVLAGAIWGIHAAILLERLRRGPGR